MKKITLALVSTFVLGLSAMAQDIGKEAASQLQNCECDEIIMISGGLEKKYAHSWIENIEYENGLIVFKKGSQKHQWNPEKIIMIEKSGTWVRVHMEKAR